MIEKYETDKNIQDQIIEKLKSENQISNKQLSEMNSSFSQSNMAIEKVVDQLRRFLINHFGQSFDDQYVKLRESLQKPQLLLPLCELIMLAHFQAKD